MPIPEVVDVAVVLHCGLAVTYSDGSVTNYVPDELLDLRPFRELSPDLPQASRRDRS